MPLKPREWLSVMVSAVMIVLYSWEMCNLFMMASVPVFFQPVSAKLDPEEPLRTEQAILRTEQSGTQPNSLRTFVEEIQSKTENEFISTIPGWYHDVLYSELSPKALAGNAVVRKYNALFLTRYLIF